MWTLESQARPKIGFKEILRFQNLGIVEKFFQCLVKAKRWKRSAQARSWSRGASVSFIYRTRTLMRYLIDSNRKMIIAIPILSTFNGVGKMEYTQSDYERERAICDTAMKYAEQFRQKNGWIVIPADAAAHPDYAACDNAMRGRVERFEILRDLPEKFSAYLSSDGRNITVWPGDVLGSAYVISSRPIGGYVSSRYYYGRATIGGKLYAWQGHGRGMLCRLRAIKGKR